MFYCIKGHKGDDLKNVPQVYKDLHGTRGGKYNFALLDCNKKLSSGKSIYERFKVNRKIKPTIFVTAPWLGNGVGKQVPDGQLNDLKTIEKYVDASLMPRATAVETDDELKRACGWNKKKDADNSSVSTCFAVLKGKRYSKTQQELIEQLIRAYPRNRYVSLSASKKNLGLSFDNNENTPSPADYALRLHAMRNGNESLTMTNPSTFEHMSTFVSHASAQPLENDAFDVITTKGGITVTKDNKSSFKERVATTRADNGDYDSKPREPKKELTAEELEQQRIDKERKAREAMDKAERESASMVEEGEEEEEEDEDEGEEGEEIMEL